MQGIKSEEQPSSFLKKQKPFEKLNLKQVEAPRVRNRVRPTQTQYSSLTKYQPRKSLKSKQTKTNGKTERQPIKGFF